MSTTEVETSPAYGWFASLLTLLREAMVQTFDADYPVEDFRDLHISLEYPVKLADYPCIWVDFEPMGELQVAGIAHREFAEADGGDTRAYKRWTFRGVATYTIVTLTSLERARLLDEVVKTMAFGDVSLPRSRFRAYIEDNEFLACNFDFDQIGVRGKAEAPGTPWNTDEIIYEITVAMECIGEFVSDTETRALVPLSSVRVYPYRTDEPDPGDQPPLADDPAEWS